MGFDKHNWFETWFNTPYYHLLYNNRDFNEADAFINKLIIDLKVKKDSRIWDLACGKGRHSIALNKLGFDVTGTDLSEESIKEALRFESERLHFYKLDMRSPFRTNYFDLVLNLFTSFGYFSCPNDDQKVFKAVSAALKRNGIFVFDYLNKFPVVHNLVPEHHVTRNDVNFEIKKRIEGDNIIKEIQVEDRGDKHMFCESVKLYDTDTIVNFAKKSGMRQLAAYGDYELNPYNDDSSTRMILIFIKD